MQEMRLTDDDGEMLDPPAGQPPTKASPVRQAIRAALLVATLVAVWLWSDRDQSRYEEGLRDGRSQSYLLGHRDGFRVASDQAAGDQASPAFDDAPVRKSERTYGGGAPMYWCETPKFFNQYRVSGNMSSHGVWLHTSMYEPPQFQLTWRGRWARGFIVSVSYPTTSGDFLDRDFPVTVSDSQVPAEDRRWAVAYAKKQSPPEQPDLSGSTHKFDLDLKAQLPGWNGDTDNLDITTKVCVQPDRLIYEVPASAEVAKRLRQAA
jgi:hypothetical protein